MAGKAPLAAFVEDFDEDTHVIVPDSRQVANTAAKLQTRLDLRIPAEPLIDGASDSGYSSRTAATANSTQSGPSGGKSPPTLQKVDMPKRGDDLARKSSSRKERKDKERIRPVRDEKMQVGATPGSAHHHAHVPRSPSKSRRRNSVLYYPEYGYETPSGYYPPSTPVEPRTMELPPQYFGRPPMPDYPPPSSPQTARYPPVSYEEYNASRSSGRPSRSNSYREAYHLERPVSYHGMPTMGHPMYPPPPPAPMYQHYEHHGPPPLFPAYAHPQYSSSPHGPGSYYTGSEYAPPTEYVPRERSQSRTRDQSRPRRSSMYGHLPVEDVFPQWEDGDGLDQGPSRETRGRGAVKPRQARDEDYYKMPPPPPPATKHKPAPQIHQIKRPTAQKAQTTQAVPSQRRSSRTMDMTEMVAALPELSRRRLSREARLPERSHSLRDSKRSISYNDHARGARVAVENSRRHRPQPYYYEDCGSRGGLEDREREAERYQAHQSGRSANALPPSAEALIPKMANGAGSENGSQKSRSNSSRGSGSKGEGENKNMTLTMNGMIIGFTDAVAGKQINIRTGDSGAVHLNIAGGRKQQQYLTGGSSYSSHTGGSGHREAEDVRRPRDDQRSERTSQRSSQSSYGHNRRYQPV